MPASPLEAPLSRQALERARAEAAPYLTSLPDIPVPCDVGGGYTHERHKDNYRLIRDAGALHALTGEAAYATLVRDVLLGYAALYPGLPQHRFSSRWRPGRLFWQCLNDAVWLHESIQGYADVRAALSAEERAAIERDVFRPMAEYLSSGAPAATFEGVINQATWAVAAVGMTGYVLGDDALVQRALMGLDGSGRTGFLFQIDTAFSPDAYYAEGPYYLRYAIMPFIAFARMIDAYQPEREIFAYRDATLVRAVHNLIQQTYAGRFLPINDAIREKGLDSPEVLFAVAAIYARTRDPTLLDVVAMQRRVCLTAEGMALGAAAHALEHTSFPFRSMLLRDGAAGDQGGVALMRGRDQLLVLNIASQGLVHSHFDRLGWMFYDHGREAVADYGAVRFLNVEAKGDGRYLAENESWAKQTIAHNTLVVDEISQFNAEWRRAGAGARVLHYGERDGATLAAGEVDGAYAGVNVRRALALVDRPEVGRPIVLDLVRAHSEGAHRYDLPLYCKGALTTSSLDFAGGLETLRPLGDGAGYRHLWDRGRAAVGADAQRIAWFNVDRFYSYVFASADVDEAILVELGANDPAHNLRHERGFVLRGDGKRDFSFVASLEAHGAYSAADEYARETTPMVASIRHVQADDCDAAIVETHTGQRLALCVSWRGEDEAHAIEFDGVRLAWRGFFGVIAL